MRCPRKAKAPIRRFVIEFRNSPEILRFVNGAELDRYSQQGVVTPDHTIRTKNWPLLVPPPEHGKADDFKRDVAQAVADFSENYRAYFERNNARVGGVKRILDVAPRVVLVPGVGMFGLGRSKKDAAVAADVAESAVAAITDAEAIGTFESISEADMFDCEYWSLEQAKLGKEPEKPLAGQIASITGAAGAIGMQRPRARLPRPAPPWRCSILMSKPRRKWPPPSVMLHSAVACDVTDPASVTRPSTRLSNGSAASTFWCRMRARPGRAASAKLTRPSCEKVSN